jgi:hypothetical protein
VAAIAAVAEQVERDILAAIGTKGENISQTNNAAGGHSRAVVQTVASSSTSDSSINSNSNSNSNNNINSTKRDSSLRSFLSHKLRLLSALEAESASVIDAVRTYAPDFYYATLVKRAKSSTAAFSQTLGIIRRLTAATAADGSGDVGSSDNSGGPGTVSVPVPVALMDDAGCSFDDVQLEVKVNDDCLIAQSGDYGNSGSRLYQELTSAMYNLTKRLKYVRDAVSGNSPLDGTPSASASTSTSFSTSEVLTSAALSSAQVVFCTLTTAGHSLVRRCVVEVDVLLVDEAAQALEAELLVPLGAMPRNMMLIGDPQQLPATVISTEVEQWRVAVLTIATNISFCRVLQMLDVLVHECSLA